MTENKLFLELLDKVESGSRFNVNFEKRSLSVGKRYIIKDGEPQVEGAIIAANMPLEDVLGEIEQLFDQYAYSIPSERSDRKRHRYFSVAPDEEITDEDMMYGSRREPAQFILEYTFLCHLINGSIQWTETLGVPGWRSGTYFWQSLENRDLVILKDWF